MSKFVSTDGACVLSRYLAAMAAAIRSTTDSSPNKNARTGVGGAEKTQNRQPLKRKILQLTLVACAAVYVGQQSIQAQGVAPGGPGGKAGWLPANKSGFGTSQTTLSKVWFTLEGGRLSEVYYPRLDTPSVRNLDFMITDGHSFAARAQDASSSTTRLVGPDQGRRDNKGKPNSLTYQIINTDTATFSIGVVIRLLRCLTFIKRAIVW